MPFWNLTSNISAMRVWGPMYPFCFFSHNHASIFWLKIWLVIIIFSHFLPHCSEFWQFHDELQKASLMVWIISSHIFHQNLLDSFRDTIHILRIDLFRVLSKVFILKFCSKQVKWLCEGQMKSNKIKNYSLTSKRIKNFKQTSSVRSIWSCRKRFVISITFSISFVAPISNLPPFITLKTKKIWFTAIIWIFNHSGLG